MRIKYKNIGIVANDAGSANIIAYWIKNLKYKNFFINVSGPALKIFKTLKINKILNLNIKTILKKSDFIISGTSHKSLNDHKIRVLSKKKNIKCAGVLDHWVTFREGFTYKKKLILPDEIWVTNKIAYKIAKKEFKKQKIFIKENLYEKGFCRDIERNKKKNLLKILYLSEPFLDKTQELAIKKFLKIIKNKKKIKIIFIGSSGFNKGKKDYMLYAASKSALVSLYVSAREVLKKKI